ncbi:NAD-dependent protein deacetylase sirtuin-1 [Nowakowskiella sp. JEL0407]|nr:NAD-dependent protein deacetylase sirtuin-1 [Nowakowskiella sp. JEL0407]
MSNKRTFDEDEVETELSSSKIAKLAEYYKPVESEIEETHTKNNDFDDDDVSSNDDLDVPLSRVDNIDSDTEIVPVDIDVDSLAAQELVELSKKMKVDALEMGFTRFFAKYCLIPVHSILKIFGYTLSEKSETRSDEELLKVYRAFFRTTIQNREKLTTVNTIEQAVQLIKQAKNIIVLTGAGVSVSCGIPDFRSENGIYARLDEFDLDDPQMMFDLEYFKIMPQTFYSFAKEIYPTNFKPSPSHMFIKLLESKGKLLRNYTQNIDTLEQVAGIKKVVQCHGSFSTASCIECGYRVPGDAIKEDVMNKNVPNCPKCGEDNNGIMKPDIVFFGESLPREFDDLFKDDKTQVDLLIVIGSSLKVAPVGSIKDSIPHDVPQILINAELLPHMKGFDVQLLGYADIIVMKLCEMLGWELDTSKCSKETKPAKEINYVHVPPNQYYFEGSRDCLT